MGSKFFTMLLLNSVKTRSLLFDLLMVQKWVLTCVSSYNLEPIFRSGLLEGPKLSLIVNGNLKMFENNYENCYYLDLDL